MSFGGMSAQALSIVPQQIAVSSVTATSMTVNVNAYTSDLSNAINNRRAVYLNYRPTMCGDDPVTAPIVLCPAIYQIPTTLSLGYSASPQPQLLPAYLTNLTPGTQYTLWISYDTGIVCVTAPCPSTNEDFQNRILVSTLSNQTNSQTNLSFSNIDSNSATVRVSIGLGDEYQYYLNDGVTFSVQYRPLNQSYSDSYETMTSTLYRTGDSYAQLSGNLSNLRAGTTYQVRLGYWPKPAPCNGYCILSVPGPVYRDTTWTFTTTNSGGNYQGPLTQKLYRGAPNMDRSQVITLQSFLIARGYLNGYADGVFGIKTHNAVRLFQNQNGLSVDGRVGPNTRAVINAMLK